jgi:hypothetical protein
MRCLRVLVIAAVAVVGLLAIGGGAMASAKTALCTEKSAPCPEGKTDGTGTEIKMNLVSGTKSKLTTEFKTVECGKSSLTAKVTSTGETISASIESLTFEECNCEVKLLTKGTLELSQISSTDNGTLKSTGTELTLQCNGTIFGNIHCIYQTSATDLGTLEGGNPAKLKVSVRLVGPATHALCSEFEGGELLSQWEAEYEVTTPKPLFIEGEGTSPPETVLCTESKNPCPAGKADGIGTEIKASLVSGTKSKFTTIYNNIECGKSSLTANVTSTGKTIGTSVEALSFEECNCEVKVLAKGTLELAQISISGTNATAKSNGAEITTLCSTTEGNVHCIYKTETTDIGTLEGGNPAKIKVSSASIPRLATDKRCAEGETAKWDVEYEVTSPKPLFTEPEVGEGTVLCTEGKNPCPSCKSDGVNTEIKASLVSGTKSKLTTPYNNIECGQSSITAKVTSTGEKIGASVEGLTFEECNCEVVVLAKGTLELQRITSTENATFKSSGTEVTTNCNTITGNVHCIYQTSATDLGTLEGGNPAKIKVSSAEVPRLTTSERCKEKNAEGKEIPTKWDVEYEVTSPKPLFIEPR